MFGPLLSTLLSCSDANEVALSKPVEPLVAMSAVEAQSLLDAIARDITVPCPPVMQAEFDRVRGLLSKNPGLLEEPFSIAGARLAETGVDTSNLTRRLQAAVEGASCLKIPAQGDPLWDPTLMNMYYGDSLDGKGLPPDYIFARAFRPNADHVDSAIAFRDFFFITDDCTSAATIAEEGLHLLGYEHDRKIPRHQEVLTLTSNLIGTSCAVQLLDGKLDGFRRADSSKKP